MTPEELHNIYRAEGEFWWYRGMRAITWALLDRALLNRSSQESGGWPDRQANRGRGLDAGCGTGWNAGEIERRYGLGMFGVDLAPLAIEYCRKRGFDRSVAASIMQLPFANQSFDAVFSFDVLSHLPLEEDERALKEFVRVLRPGGLLFLRIPAFRTLRSRHSQFIAETHRYRSPELTRKLRALDCSIVRSSYANAFLSPVAWFKFRVLENLVKARASSGVEEIPPPWLNSILTAVLRCEAVLIGKGLSFGFGQSLIVMARKSGKG